MCAHLSQSFFLEFLHFNPIFDYDPEMASAYKPHQHVDLVTGRSQPEADPTKVIFDEVRAV